MRRRERRRGPAVAVAFALSLLYAGACGGLQPRPLMPSTDKLAEQAVGAAVGTVVNGALDRLPGAKPEAPGRDARTACPEPLEDGDSPDAWERQADCLQAHGAIEASQLARNRAFQLRRAAEAK